MDVMYYKSDNNQTPFTTWLRELGDVKGRAKIHVRINKVRLRNFGDHGSVGKGVWELKEHFGPGYRIYFGKPHESTILILCGGIKKRQSTDIVRAKLFWSEYKLRMSQGDKQ